MNSFQETGLQQEVLDAVAALGFEQPTPIQAKAIPHLLNSDQDIIGSAQTGTGKTGAFGLPLVHLVNPNNKNTQALILCPTRELCLQITDDLKKYAKFKKGLNVVPIFGGASITDQIKKVKNGAQIVVATPGRCVDMINRNKLRLDSVERVVLDEADEMLTMGFKEDLNTILGATPSEKQTLLFSATMSKAIKDITKKYMKDPFEIEAARVNMGSENVQHYYYVVSYKNKYELLKRIADSNPDIYGIVFCRTRRDTKEVANLLMQDGYNADALHGDLAQGQRDEVMGRFRRKSLQILVATDVAARGLDVNELTHVINYSLPDDSEVYTHRSGRTGRAGNKGVSIAVIGKNDIRKIKDIERNSNINFTKALAPTGQEICEKQLFTLIDKIEKVKVDEKQIAPFLPGIYQKLEWLSREDLIKHFVSAEFNRFLEYYRYAQDINLSAKPSNERESRGKSERRKTNFSRLYINVGSKNHLNPNRLMGMVNEGLDSSEATIGRIDIMKNFSFFEIDKKFAPKLIDQLKGVVFEGKKVMLEVSEEKAPSNDGGGGRRGGRSEGRRSSGGRRDRDRRRSNNRKDKRRS